MTACPTSAMIASSSESDHLHAVEALKALP
jgi:hypothetical protein